MIEQILVRWNSFWFAPRANRDTTFVRASICLVAMLWWASFLSSVDLWFGPEGWMSASVAAGLIEFEQSASWQKWSPLWLSDSTLFCKIWLSGGILLSLLAAMGWGGRITLAVLLFWIISWAHRLVWLQGPIEPALVACVAYLIVQPGNRLWELSSTRTPTIDWTAQLTMRLLQTHLWILLAAGLLSQMASLMWWRGEAVWWMASASRSLTLTPSMLDGKASLVNGLTHAIVVVEMLGLWLLTVPVARPLGILCALLATVSIGLIADQFLYGLLLAACLPAFWRTSTST